MPSDVGSLSSHEGSEPRILAFSVGMECSVALSCPAQGLRASSLQFTSPLEFNAIFRDGFTLRLDLTAGSKIRDPVTAKLKHARLL